MDDFTKSSLISWLGDAHTEMTEEQLNHFAALVGKHESEIISTRPDYGTENYFADDYAEDDAAAWQAAHEISTGTFSLPQRGRALIEARTAAYQGAIMATLNGESEVQAAQAATISRPTLRKLLGK